MRRRVKQLLLDAVRMSCGASAHDGLARALAGVGFVFAMHRVVEQKSDFPAPHLTITAAFLDSALTFLRDAGVEFISLATLERRLAEGGPFTRPFACFSFDDGYRDNLTLGLPILRKHQAPATIFTPSGGPDRTMDVWFLRLAEAVMENDALKVDFPSLSCALTTRTSAQKVEAYLRLSEYVHKDINRNKGDIRRLLPSESISDEALSTEYILSWDELRELADDPLISIGGHTVHHPVLCEMSDGDAYDEIAIGRDRLAAELDRSIDLFSYPYGGRQEIGCREIGFAKRAGFKLAVTTFYDQIRPRHGKRLFEIPRIGLGALREDMAALAFDISGCVRPRAPASALPAAELFGKEIQTSKQNPDRF